MGLSVIIPSKTASNLVPCVEEVRAIEGVIPRIIVIDDGLDLSAADTHSSSGCWLCDMDPTLRIAASRPFIFARNVNLGIEAAGDSDVILLNDDALLRTPGGFTAMQREAQKHPEYGVIAASCNNVGNRNQWPQQGGQLREEPRMVCFVCVLIPRRTIETVGLLDERFVGYGYDDDDFCLRTRRAGLKIGIFDGCYVDHSKLTSTFRGEQYPSAGCAQNAQLFRAKHGASNLAL